MNTISIKATTLTPFNYGHLPINGGVATIPDMIGDRAVSFALAAALGMLSPAGRLPAKNYRAHLAAIPWRSSVLMADDAKLLPPLARRSGLGEEGGYPDKVRRSANSGNFKEYFLIQEVPSGQVFRGALFGPSPFDHDAVSGKSGIVVRIGSNRTGMVLIERDPTTSKVRLNAATALLFDRHLGVARYLHYETQITALMGLAEAAAEVATWN